MNGIIPRPRSRFDFGNFKFASILQQRNNPYLFCVAQNQHFDGHLQEDRSSRYTLSSLVIRASDPFPTALPFMPSRLSLKTMREAVCDCRGCDLYKDATHAVFGEGSKSSILMFIGEQPGDQEDLAGRPFVGPAGRMFDEALQQVGIDRNDVYVTNAVKHFKFTTRGKRRLHGKPNAREIRACRPWLEGEIEVVKPKMLVALGATAAQSLFGSDFRVTQRRGQSFKFQWAPWCMATVHPSSLLRAPDEAARRAAKQAFLQDFKIIARQFFKLESSHSSSKK